MNAAVNVTEDVVLRETRYAPWLRLEPHVHPWAFMTFVLQGTVGETCGRSSERRSIGSLRIMPAGTEHANEYQADGARCLVAEIDAASDGPFGRSGVLDRGTSEPAGSAASAIASRMYAEYRHHDDLTPLALDGLLRELFVAAARSMRQGRAQPLPPWLRRVRDRLHDDCRDVPTMRSLAAEAGVHPSHLVRMFRRHLGRTPGEYLAHVRIDRARHALATTTTPISQIALSVGFSDQAHLTRRFRALTGTTPARYRTDAGSSLPFAGA